MSLEIEIIDYSSGWWQFGAVGGIIATIIILSLLIYTLIYYCKFFVSPNKNYDNQLQHTQLNKTVYILSIIYLISGLFANSIYSLTRSNIITSISFNDYTLFQCQFGYITSILFFALNRIFLYVLIIKRIKISFKGSNYEYKPILFLCLYWMMSIVTTINLILWILSQQNLKHEWILITNSNEKSIFCNNQLTEDQDIAINVGWIILMVIEIAFKFYLLYLFWNGLFKLYKTLANDVIADGPEPIEEQKEDNNGNMKKDKIKMDSMEHKKLKFMCELIKKQTILLFFGVSSTFIYFMFAAISFEGTTLLTWDCLINSLCIFLMFYFAQNYWKCCTKFGCCCCCYITQNLDEYLSQAIEPNNDNQE